MYQSDFASILVQKKQKSRPVNQSAKSEQTREKRRKAKKNGDLTISVFWSERLDLNQRPLLPQSTLHLFIYIYFHYHTPTVFRGGIKLGLQKITYIFWIIISDSIIICCFFMAIFMTFIY